MHFDEGESCDDAFQGWTIFADPVFDLLHVLNIDHHNISPCVYRLCPVEDVILSENDYS